MTGSVFPHPNRKTHQFSKKRMEFASLGHKAVQCEPKIGSYAGLLTQQKSPFTQMRAISEVSPILCQCSKLIVLRISEN